MSPMPAKNWTEVIDGKRYSIAKAALIASDYYWDGSNWERHGRNTFLYRTPKGNFFQVSVSQWQGERDVLTPLTQEEALALWDELPEKEVSFEEAFGYAPEEA